jgi:hypothetical protein
MASLIGAAVSALTFLLGFIGLPAAGVYSPAGTPSTVTATATVTATVTATPQTSATTPETPVPSSPGAGGEDYAPILTASKISIPTQSGVCNGNFMFVDLDEPRANASSGSPGRIDGGPCIEDSHNNWLSNGMEATTSMATPDAAGCDKAIRSSPANSLFRLRNGLNWCQYTSEKDLALVHVVSTSDDGSLTVEVTTWSVG